jgi:DNA-binding PadR family transcriptional regulator
VHQTYNSIRKAHSLGLVKSRIDNSRYPHRNLVSLTEKGEKVAAKISEILSIVND